MEGDIVLLGFERPILFGYADFNLLTLGTKTFIETPVLAWTLI
jgi:hypothetical protein